jgi:hypothetical protein
MSDVLGPWPGLPGLADREASLRWLLALLGCVWALAAARGQRRAAVVAGVVFAGLAAGFWALALGRPYGLPFAPDVAREAGSAVLASEWRAPVGLVPDSPFVGGPWARLALLGVPASWLVSLPSALPLVVLPGIGLLVHLLWRARAAPLGAILWWTCATGELTTLRGAGLLPGLWSRPAGGLGLLLGVAAVLVAVRLRGRAARAPWLALALGGAWLACSGPGAPLALVPTLLLATLDHAPWWLLASVSRRRWDPATRALVMAGLLGLLGGAGGLPVDAWGAAALLRLGLLLGVARTLDGLCPALGRWLRPALGARARLSPPLAPRALALGLIVLLLAPASAHAWWRPQRLDPLVSGSLTPLPPDLLAAAAWARSHTPREAVFVTGAEWAAAVPALAARRVLYAPALVSTPDAEKRARLSYLAVAGEDEQGRRNLRRYGVTHLFAHISDVRAWNLSDWDALEATRRFRLRHAGGTFRVFEIVQPEQPTTP